jgi:hypothetical protein
MHSAERICTNLSTGSVEGQALAHFPQSMQLFWLRVIRSGLKDASKPKSAP